MTFFGNAAFTHVSRLSKCCLRFVVGWLILSTVYSKDVGKIISLELFWYKGQIEPWYPKCCILETLHADKSIDYFLFFKYFPQKVCTKSVKLECQRKVSMKISKKSVHKKCTQKIPQKRATKVSTKSVHQKCIHKKFPQKVSTKSAGWVGREPQLSANGVGLTKPLNTSLNPTSKHSSHLREPSKGGR